jgi:hypothetical protein
MIRGKCESCRKIKWFIKQRSYIPKKVGQKITSKGELCRACFKAVKKMIS